MDKKILLAAICLNNETTLGEFLSSVSEACGSLEVEVIVIDNNSTDRTVEIAIHHGVEVIRTVNRGYAAAVNLAVHSRPQCDVIIESNADLTLRPLSVERLVEALREDGVGIAAPRMLRSDGSVSPSVRREPAIRRSIGLSRTGWPLVSEYVLGEAAYSTAGPVDWAEAVLLAMTRECYNAVGGWDESYYLYSEDAAFCLRARDIGYSTVFVPGAVIVHDGGGSGRNATTYSMQVVNRVRLYTRRNGMPNAIIFFLLTIVGELVWLCRGRVAAFSSLRALVVPQARPQVLQSTTFIPS